MAMTPTDQTAPADTATVQAQTIEPKERTVDQDAVREHAIREAAYRRFEARGGADGDEKQDWLDAQAEVDGRST